MEDVAWFFILAAAWQWPGTLWLRRPLPGSKRPWEAIYEGEHVYDYYDILRDGRSWPELIAVEEIAETQLVEGAPWPGEGTIVDAFKGARR